MAYSSGLDDDSIQQQQMAGASPLAAMGIDPDEAALDRPGTMAKLNLSPADRMASAYSRAPIAANPTPTPKTPAPSSPAVSPSGGSMTPWQQLAMQGGEGALRTASMAEQLAAPSQEEDDAQNSLKTLEAQRSAAAAKAAQGPYDPATGKLLDQYKPGIGTKILRGVGNFARGGIFGAIAPAEVGLTPYNAPNAQYGRDQAVEQAQVANLDQQLSSGSERFKQLVDARKARATAAKDSSGLYRDTTLAATGQESAEAADRRQTTAEAEAAEKAREDKARDEAAAARQREQDNRDAARLRVEQGHLSVEQRRLADEEKGGGNSPRDIKNQEEANGILQDHLAEKQEWADQWARQPDGSYRTADLTSSSPKTITAKEFADHMESFRGKANAKLSSKGYQIDQKGQIQKLDRGGPMAAAAPATPAPIVAPHTKAKVTVGQPVNTSQGVRYVTGVDKTGRILTSPTKPT